MSETPTPPVEPQTEPIPPTKETMEEVKENTAKMDESAKTIRALTREINALKKEREADKAKMESDTKKVLLEKVQQGGFDPDNFKDLDNASLEAVLKSLSTISDKIIIPKGEDKIDDISSEPMIFNPSTGEMEPFYKSTKKK